ncbi:MAG: hypothetical protein GX115_08825 [Ruminiclostridium sp.]|nr:hypothetical protein [Ruminiclostridium sp.]
MFGFLFIVISLGNNFPLLKIVSVLNVYERIIIASEESITGKVVKIQYEKQGKTCEGLFRPDSEFGSLVQVRLNADVGKKVRISLNRNIESLMIRDEDKEKTNSTRKNGK